MLGFKDADVLQKSFQSFARQPENAELVERAQKEELLASLEAHEAALAHDVRAKLSRADDNARRTLEPLLEYSPLTRLVHSLLNDTSKDISAWVTNPVVVDMLRRARQMLQAGVMTEQQLETALLAHIKNPSNPYWSEFQQQTSTRILVTTPEHLSAAMNEQLEERQQGNRAYLNGDPEAALHHYTRGLAVLGLLHPANQADKEVVQEAQVALLLNSAAAHLMAEAYGACVEACGRALQLDFENVTAYVRRAKAHMARRDYQAATADLEAAERLSYGSREQELATLRAELRALRRRDRETDRGVYARMFKS